MKKKQQQEKVSRRVALLGLLGTALTVCGTLSGALISGTTTVYKVLRASEQLAVAPPQGGESLRVDVGQINISMAEAEALDEDAYLVFPDLGFALPQPRPLWQDQGALTYADLFAGQGVSLSPLIFYYAAVGFDWDEQPMRQYRYAQPVLVTYLPGSRENGVLVDPAALAQETVAFHSQITVLAIDRKVAEPAFNLDELALAWGERHLGSVNTLIAPENADHVFAQVSWRLEQVAVEGRTVDLTLERWLLVIEGHPRYYLVEVQFVPSAAQPAGVWDDLQAYMEAFRVIDLPSGRE